MANPTEITVTDLAANSSVTQPAVNTIDTNGTVPVPAGGATERVVLEVINTDDAALTVTIKAGAAGAGAVRGAIGDLAVSLPASGTAGDKKIIGPFESARFVQSGGKINVQFAAATGSPAATVRAYRLPKAV
jgi:hypothetical protein